MHFCSDVLNIDCAQEARRISAFIGAQASELKKDGILIGLSGGIDSALSAALSVKALGPQHVKGLILPERESDPLSEQFALKHAGNLGIQVERFDITPVLEKSGAYSKRDEAVSAVFPNYNSKCSFKITLPLNLLNCDAYNIFTITMEDEYGHVKTARLNADVLRCIVAATNIKQRTRMVMLYQYAEKMNYLVCGTTNKTEYMEGFFVKYGDGGVDLEPIEHLYKSQVYQLAEQLDVCEEIIRRAPTPDTYSMDVSDEEFYFRLPFATLDMLLYAWEHSVPIADICAVMSLSETQLSRAFRDFSSKFNATKNTRQPPPTIEAMFNGREQQ